jgi:hypothetical protein
MYPYLGDFAAGSSIFVPFATYNSSGASVTITGLAVTDIEVYKGASMTQRSSDAGYALVDTDGIDLDGITGIHGFTIDTNDNTDSGFYAAGNDYTVVVSSITADSQTVSFIAARFSIENRVSNVTKWLGTAVATPDTAGYPKTTIKSGSGTGEVSLSSGGVTLSTSGLAAAADAVLDEALSGHVAAGSLGARLAIIRSNTAQAGAGTTITLDASASAVDDFYNNQQIFIVAGTGAGQGRIISDYVGSTKVATVSTWATNPSSDSVFVITPFGSIPGASAPTAGEVADAVCDELLSGHTTEGSLGAALSLFNLHVGTAQAGASSSITLDATGSSATDDTYNYQAITIRSGTGAGQTRQITDYNGTTKVATVNLAWTTNPSTDSNYIIHPIGLDAATVASIATGVWAATRAGNATAGSFGEYVNADATRISGDATAADNAEAFFDGTGYAGTNNVMPSVTTVTGNVNGNVGGNVTGSVGSVVGNVGGNVTGSVGSVVGAVGSVTAGVTVTTNSDKTGYSLSNGGVDALFTRQLTESYAADGAAPTVAQALMLIQQMLGDFAITGTTLTVKRVDGSTSAATFTLNDGTTPTSITRAT